MSNSVLNQNIQITLTVDESTILQTCLNHCKNQMSEEHFTNERALIEVMLAKVLAAQSQLLIENNKEICSTTYAKMHYNENNDTIEVKKIQHEQ